MIEWQKEIEQIHNNTAMKKSDIRPWGTEDVRFLALALCGEAGELANLIKKEWRGDIHPSWGLHVRKELADVRVYLHLLAKALGVDIDEAVCETLPGIREKFNAWPTTEA